MATVLTEAKIKQLRPKPSAYFSWDSQALGLALKVTPAGRKLWVLQLIYPGHRVQTKRTLGQWPAMPVEEARVKARHWLELVRTGQDPAQVEAMQREANARKAASTFGKVAEAYMAARRGKKRRAAVDEQEIRRNLVSVWGDKPISSISSADVRRHIMALAERAPYEARNAWGHADRIFKFAVFEGWLATSPCASLPKRMVFANVRLAPRQRVLSDKELAALWRIADHLGYPEGTFYKWLLLTGVRLNEAAKASWDEFNLSAAEWTIPATRFKSDSVHIVPLTDEMVDLLASIPPRDSRWVFSFDGDKPMVPGSKLKRKIDRHMQEMLGNVPPWVNHDIRRTVRTQLAAMGVADHIAEMVLGHGRKGIQRVYDQHKYLNEIRAALEAWSRRLATFTDLP